MGIQNLIKIDFFKLKSRLGRVRYLGQCSFWFGIMLLSIFLDSLIPNYHSITTVISLILFGVFVINITLLKIRRINDFDRSGGWILLSAVPIIGFLWFVSTFLIRGSAGSNKYGIEADKPSFGDLLLISVCPGVLFFFTFLRLIPNNFVPQVLDRLQNSFFMLRSLNDLLYSTDAVTKTAAGIELLISFALIIFIKWLFEKFHRNRNYEVTF
jgi:uncharacterized membrane protein YhaH (DUF805 family)